MKLGISKKIHYDSGPNMTPLVDVVMVILIFLMLAGSFGGVEHYLATNIPLASRASGNTKKAFGDDVIIDVRVDASAADPNAWAAKCGDVNTASPAKLKEAMQEKLEEYQKNGTGVDKLQVIINPNKNVKWKSLIAVYAAAVDAGYTKITFLQSK